MSLQSNAHLSRFPANGEMAMHTHTRPWLCVVLSGDYQETILRRSHTHRAGHMLSCPEHTPHSQRFGSTGARKILFAPDPASVTYLAESGVRLAAAPFLASADILTVGSRLARELTLDDAHSGLAAQGLILELVALFARRGATLAMKAAPLWLTRVQEALDHTTHTTPRLSDLARHADRHPVHLAKVFKAHFGETIGGYARRKRALRAADLLSRTRLPLTDIALTCGYADAPQFSRGFRAVFGVTPSEYRARS